MRLRSVRDSTLDQLNERAGVFVAACGYEHRSCAISRLVTAPERKIALCFKEWPDAIARHENQRKFTESGFECEDVGSNEPGKVRAVVSRVTEPAFRLSKAISFDISSMTRAWHGAIVSELRRLDTNSEVETLFAYAPGKFTGPLRRQYPNEFVEPLEGFAALSPPDLPVAAIIGLGYEKDRALGLEQLLDPERTMLLVPKSGEQDKYFPEVLKSNRRILARTLRERIFYYSIAEPAATFATLASIVSDLRESYRVVLASLGPKVFGLLCLLLASRFPDVSVWRVSSGVHGQPRDARADLNRAVVISAVWGPWGPSD
jgi:hypothetical protein